VFVIRQTETAQTKRFSAEVSYWVCYSKEVVSVVTEVGKEMRVLDNSTMCFE
jgi:hypothetical protein